MSDPVTFACACEKVQGEVAADTLKSGTRVVCHCDDCRAFQIALGRDDPGAQTGVDLLQIAPANMHFVHGTEHLAAMRLSPRGLVRWYASCCDTPLAATMPGRAIPFAGLLIETLHSTDHVRRVSTHGFLKNADGTTRHKNIGRLVRGLVSRTFAAYTSGTAKMTPFRDPDSGALIVEPEVIGKARKAAIYSSL